MRHRFKRKAAAPRAPGRDLKLIGRKPKVWLFDELLHCWPPHGPVVLIDMPVQIRVHKVIVSDEEKQQ